MNLAAAKCKQSYFEPQNKQAVALLTLVDWCVISGLQSFMVNGSPPISSEPWEWGEEAELELAVSSFTVARNESMSVIWLSVSDT
jgi:hypothetical protein